MLYNQVLSLRKRQVIHSYLLSAADQDHRDGTYWSISSSFADFKAGSALPDSLGLDGRDMTALAQTPTRLKALPDDVQEKLINWGYAICDTALRRHLNPPPGAPTGLPYRTRGL